MKISSAKTFLTRKVLLCAVVLLGSFRLNSAIAGSDEGRLYNAIVYDQTGSTATLATNSYAFIADIRNSDAGEEGSVTLPPNAGWATNPVNVVAPSQLVGAHYLYEQDFSTLSALDAAFPAGDYSFNVVRPYTSATTSFSAQVAFSGTVPIPSAVPQITNNNWSNGILNIQPAEAQVYYAPATGVSFSWEAVGAGGGSAGGSQGPGAPGLLDLTGMLGFGQTYSMEFRLYNTDNATTIVDPNAPSGAYQQTSTYSTLLASIVRFQIQTPAAASDFSIQSAIFSANGQNWNDTSFLQGLVNQNAVVWNMNESTLTNNALFNQNGTLTLSYTNSTGEFTGTIPYSTNSFSNYVVLPNPAQSVPETSSFALITIGFPILRLVLRRNRKRPP